MDKKTREVLKKNIDEGISELGDQEGIRLQSRTYIKSDNFALTPKDFFFVFQPFALVLSQLKLSTNHHRIFWYLLSIQSYENFIQMDVKTISENMGEISERTVIRCLNELVELNIINKIPHPSDKRRHDYFINPVAVWKGSMYSREKKLKKLKDNQINLEFGNTKLIEGVRGKESK